MIRDAGKKDCLQIVEIYNHFVETSTITFETELVSADEMGKRIDAVKEDYPWIVFEKEGRVLGFAYVCKWKTRNAYKQSAEVSIYIRQGQQGNGIGKLLMRELMDRCEETDIHCLIAGIALPNNASIALHEKFGFEKVAHFKEVGRKFDKWIDVGYWERVV